MDERLDGMAEWFSPDVAAPFGRLYHHPVVRTSPRIDVSEISSTLIITADVPGVRKDNLHLPHVEEIKATLTDGVLEVRIPEPPQKQSEPRAVAVDHALSAIELIVRGALPVGEPSPESV